MADGPGAHGRRRHQAALRPGPVPDLGPASAHAAVRLSSGAGVGGPVRPAAGDSGALRTLSGGGRGAHGVLGRPAAPVVFQLVLRKGEKTYGKDAAWLRSGQQQHENRDCPAGRPGPAGGGPPAGKPDGRQRNHRSAPRIYPVFAPDQEGTVPSQGPGGPGAAPQPGDLPAGDHAQDDGRAAGDEPAL